MNYLRFPIFNNVSNANVNSVAVNFEFVQTVSFQAFFTDVTAAGTLKLQGSNDPATATPTNWSDLSNGAKTVTAGATVALDPLNTCWQWVRAVWTSTGGAGTFTCNIKTIGDA